MSDDIDILTFVFDSSSDESTDPLTGILFCDTDSSADSIEENLIIYRQPKRQCKLNYLVEIVPFYSEEEFIKNFRISRSLYTRLCSEFESSSNYQQLRPDKRSSAEVHLALLLWFAGRELCSFRDLAHRFSMSTASVCRIMERTIVYFSDLAADKIKWPLETKMKQTSLFFQKKSSLSNVIGAIGSTDVPIDPQKVDKNCTKLYIQAISDENHKFLDLYIAFLTEEGSIFQTSPACQRLKDICRNYRIVGDSTYPSGKNLLAPYVDNEHLTESQRMYNKKLNSCHVSIQSTLEMLKKRFPQLNYCQIKGKPKLIRFVKACCVLHNLADESDLDFKVKATGTSGKPTTKQEISLGRLIREEISKNLQP